MRNFQSSKVIMINLTLWPYLLHLTGRLVSRSRATNTLMEITAKIHSGDSFCDNIVEDPLPEGSDIDIAVKIDVGHDAGAKEEDDVLSCLSLEDIVLLESCKPKVPSPGLANSMFFPLFFF